MRHPLNTYDADKADEIKHLFYNYAWAAAAYWQADSAAHQNNQPATLRELEQEIIPTITKVLDIATKIRELVTSADYPREMFIAWKELEEEWRKGLNGVVAGVEERKVDIANGTGESK